LEYLIIQYEVADCPEYEWKVISSFIVDVIRMKENPAVSTVFSKLKDLGYISTADRPSDYFANRTLDGMIDFYDALTGRPAFRIEPQG
jgi:hypothetical protein